MPLRQTSFALLLLTTALTAQASGEWIDRHQPKFLNSLVPAPEYPSELVLDPQLGQRLMSAAVGEQITVPGLAGLQPSEVDGKAELQLQRITVRGPASRTIVFENGQRTILPPSPQRYFRLLDGTMSLVLSYDPRTEQFAGWASDGHGHFELEGTASKLSLNAVAEVDSAVQECGVGHQSHRLPGRSTAVKPEPLIGKSLAGADPIYEALVAVDTDNELMFANFNNDSGAAQTFVNNTFAAMNVFFERDLDLRLVRGDLIIRIDTTPAGNPDFNADPYEAYGSFLSEFGATWLDSPSLQAIDGAFVSILSARGSSAANPLISPGSFSGIAWVDAYCARTRRFPGSNSGSFNVNRFGRFYSPGSLAGLWGHELGHNLGSSHTHCEAVGPGGAYVDECHNREGGCYSGPASCPAAGTGTVMSYCNPGLYDGPGSCGTRDDFDPLIINNVLSPRIQANAPSCITFAGPPPGTIYRDGFESP